MDANTPTHFNCLIAGTGLAESILAAALSKSGYSVLQLDSAPYYGTEHASLSLSELADWAAAHPDTAQASAAAPPEQLLPLSQRFAFSLFPVLLCAKGEGIDLLVRSRVATYLQFGLLGGVGLWRPDQGEAVEGKGKGKIERVPASKADVFNDASMSLVEKRRLTKLLLFAAGQDPLEEDKVVVAEPELPFKDYLQKAYSLSGAASDSLSYALALCSSPSDLALSALRRLRAIIHSIGRYGPSPYLVGHYGGAGDLVGGFSRICAVWGGGQILGRPLLPLVFDPPRGTPVPPSQPPFMVHENPPPPPAVPVETQGDVQEIRPLGIPVQLEDSEAPVMFTGDWVVCSPHLRSTLFPSTSFSPFQPVLPASVHLIAILPCAIPFPLPHTSDPSEELSEAPGDLTDSNLFVFPPKALKEELGTVTALQVGKGTMSCPEGYHVLYLAAPLLSTFPDTSAADLLTPYLDALLSLVPCSSASSPPPREPAPAASPLDRISPMYSVAYLLPATPSLASPSSSQEPSLPRNLMFTPQLPSASQSASLITALDELVPLVEGMFWRIVGEEGRGEGVEMFKQEEGAGDEDED
ncbi:hypothetical protein JCM1841_006804 [Sporobolomyces salmonicolor]